VSARLNGKRVALAIVGSLYALLLLGSWGYERAREPDSWNHKLESTHELPVFGPDGVLDDTRTATVVTREWTPGSPVSGSLPVVWLHGSPGGGGNFAELAPRLAERGRASIALDLPGFGDSDRRLPDLGARAHARNVLALMDAEGIERAHVVGWSNGGAVGLNMADIAPDRVASLALIASVGLQETEGSGSHAFEHAKYDAGLVALTALQALTPDFGFFGSPSDLSWLQNFQQTDQASLGKIMETLRTPTLILHGRHDFLTPSWGAERHRETMPTSRLVMLDASHFIPMLQVDEATPILEAHFTRHDTPGTDPLTDYDNRAPLAERHGVAAWIESLGVMIRDTPWWVLVVVIGLLARWRPMLAVVVCGMYVGRVDLDIAVAWVGLVAGRFWRPPSVFDARCTRLGRFVRGLTIAATSFVLLGAVFILEQDTFPLRVGPDDLTLRFGLAGLLAWLVFGSLALHALRSLPRRRGRQLLLAQFARLINHEWWPAWAIYLGVVPIWIGRVFHKNGVLAFTAANPGIERGGGFVGESKNTILAALPTDPAVLAHEPIDAAGTPGERAQRALNALHTRPELGGLPIILKPESGERGASVKLARSEADVHAYFELVLEPAQVQRYHPGPCEYGVFWVRQNPEPDAAEAAGVGDTAGMITGITRKVFFELTGDGRRTLGRLILAHPRLRCQAGVFAQRHAARWHEVLGADETLRLGLAGNHAQGCKFEDGTHLTTPELLAAIDRLAQWFAGVDGQGLDYARFDVRTTSEDALQRGEIAVIEINGVTSEPTHLYDPAMPIGKAWGVLRAHWRRLYRVADARIEAGGKPLGAIEALAMWRAARRRVVHRAD
jgi:pimeloyl-ACP methyl ester carboxylesterase